MHPKRTRENDLKQHGKREIKTLPTPHIPARDATNTTQGFPELKKKANGHPYFRGTVPGTGFVPGLRRYTPGLLEPYSCQRYGGSLHIYHQLGRLVSESACERKDPGSNPAADMVDAGRNTAWDLDLSADIRVCRCVEMNDSSGTGCLGGDVSWTTDDGSGDHDTASGVHGRTDMNNCDAVITGSKDDGNGAAYISDCGGRDHVSHISTGRCNDSSFIRNGGRKVATGIGESEASSCGSSGVAGRTLVRSASCPFNDQAGGKHRNSQQAYEEMEHYLQKAQVVGELMTIMTSKQLGRQCCQLSLKCGSGARTRTLTEPSRRHGQSSVFPSVVSVSVAYALVGTTNAHSGLELRASGSLKSCRQEVISTPWPVTDKEVK
ncbi:hypothetical protein FHG87_016822 [Trinorchestia longiramus]|nr:hypothetical protein FHG87_016822 [Trinorchestia longiramus]